MNFGHRIANEDFADFRILILPDQRARALVEGKRLLRICGILLIKPPYPVDSGAVVDDVEAIRIAPQRFFNIGKSVVAVSIMHILLQPCDGAFLIVVSKCVTDERVDGYLEQVGHFGDQIQLRRRYAAFPF